MRLHDLFSFDEVRAYPGTGHKWDDYFGVELEIENPTTIPRISLWTTHEDASLRGGIEYVTAHPMGGSALESAVDNFYSAGIEFTNGPRTSTHIHVNMTDANVATLRAMIVAMYTIEEGLFTVIGNARKWSGYSMPLSAMDPSRLRVVLSSENAFDLANNISPNRNVERYYGMNLSVRRHGTVEFRYFPGGPTKDELTSWIDLIAGVKAGAKNTTVEQLAGLDNASSLAAWLQTMVNPYWWETLTAVFSVEQMYEKFVEVAAFLVDGDNITRRDMLIFPTPGLFGFIKKNKIVGDKGSVYLDNIFSQLTVVSLNDWQYYLQTASTMDAAEAQRAAIEELRRRQQRDSDDDYDPDDDDYEAPEWDEAPAPVAEAAPTVTLSTTTTNRRTAQVQDVSWGLREVADRMAAEVTSTRQQAVDSQNFWEDLTTYARGGTAASTSPAPPPPRPTAAPRNTNYVPSTLAQRQAQRAERTMERLRNERNARNARLNAAQLNPFAQTTQTSR